MTKEIIYGKNLLDKFISRIPKNKSFNFTIVTCFFNPETFNFIHKEIIEKIKVYFDIMGLQKRISKDADYSYFGIKHEGGLFHPKIYFLEGEVCYLMISSSNFTMASQNNFEIGYIFEGDEACMLWEFFFPNINALDKISDRDNLNSMINSEGSDFNFKKWIHQDRAVEIFLKKKFGILEMATGSGKTRTAIKILNSLVKSNDINGAVITTFGTDLLDQWHKEILLNLDQSNKIAIYRQYGRYKDLSSFVIHPDNSIILISKDFLPDLAKEKKESLLFNKLLICDEVHHMGAKETINSLDNSLQKFPYRLGLSATPEREYDEQGNEFVRMQIGPIIFKFGLKEAIEKGILCEFDYIPLKYKLDEDDKNKMKSYYAKYNKDKKINPKKAKKNLYINLAKVRKLSKAKIPIFKKYLENNPDILNRTIIFVETMEYGYEIQKIIIEYNKSYHTYYSDDDKENLLKFSKGKINCLLTCKKISEGIDIHSVNNVILFSASRAKLETIQRIGRSLRLDPSNPDKKAKIVDFVIELESDIIEKDYKSTDYERCRWLNELSKTKVKNNGRIS